LFCGKADNGILEGDCPEEGPVHWGNGILHKIFLHPFCSLLTESGYAVGHVGVWTWFLSGHSKERAALHSRPTKKEY
jgi:hypothetical protein